MFCYLYELFEKRKAKEKSVPNDGESVGAIIGVNVGYIEGATVGD